jgi:ubiquinone biosynthesis protein COQ9
MTDYAEMTLDELRAAMIGEIARNAAFDGWGPRAIETAAGSLGADAGIVALAYPGGATDMIDAWFASIDRAMATACPQERLATLKVREKITALVQARLAVLAPERESLRRALAILAMPQNLPLAGRLAWRSADVMWRCAGDRATDYNHYTKRAILAGVYGATIQVFVDDAGEGYADTRAFLARRIDGIMRFEKAKAGFLARRGHLPSLSRFVGRLRYPAV